MLAEAGLLPEGHEDDTLDAEELPYWSDRGQLLAHLVRGRGRGRGRSRGMG